MDGSVVLDATRSTSIETAVGVTRPRAVARAGSEKEMVLKRATAAGLVLLVFAAPGCEFGRRLQRKPWGKGAWIPALVCGGLGAGAGWIVQNNRPGTSCVREVDQEGTVLRAACVRDNKEQWKGASVGGAIGFALCALAGHALLDPEPTPTLPPPPPTPVPTPEETPPVKKKIVLRGVQFDYDKSDLRPESRPVLDEAASVLRENPEIRVSIEGHTDSRGSEEYNMALSYRRANAVYRYLVAAGVAPERLEVIGYGESRPVASNDTESGRAQNRRVELRVVETRS